MGHQSYHYLKLKGSTYYYSRRVPKCLLSLSKTDPPPMKWSAVMFRETEDQNGYEAAQAGRDCHKAAAG
jgi:hypothetical protein